MSPLPKILTVLLVLLSCTVSAAAAPPKMRPYTGIGILLMPSGLPAPAAALTLYEEPALSRLGELDQARIPAYEWIFGSSGGIRPLIVMSRKGQWLRVTYDEAGREGWLSPPRPMVFQSWEQFLKGNMSQLLPGLQKKYYQAYQRPDSLPLRPMSPQQRFKVLQLENDWAMVLIEQDTLGWLRWRDDDGRLLIGIITEVRTTP